VTTKQINKVSCGPRVR